MLLGMFVSACGPTPTPEVVEVEKVVTQVVKETVKETVIVEGTPEVVEKEVTKVVEVEQVVTATPEPSPTPKSEEPVSGGVFKAAVNAPVPSIDTQVSVADATMQVTQQIVESLVALDESYGFTPLLAESWDVSEDGKTYTFHLRRGRKFHNGKEMTAEDVIASMDRYLEVSGRKAQFEVMESYEAVDDYTVVMNLAEPRAAFLSYLALPVAHFSIFPKEVMESVGTEPMEAEHLVGTGPYKLVTYEPDRLITMERFEDYEPVPGERNGAGGAKVPYFDEIEFHIVPEAGSRMAGLDTGDYDWVFQPTTTELERIKADPNLQLKVLEPAAGNYIFINHANEFTNDVTFRQAVLAALNMESINMAALQGVPELFALNECLWSPSTYWYFEDDFATEQYDQRDIEKATQLLAEAGYDGEEIVFVTSREYPTQYGTMMAMADQLGEAGVNVKVEILDWPGVISKWSETDTWHFSVASFNSTELLNPNNWISYWKSDSESIVNCGYGHPDMDAALDALDRATTQEERRELLKDVQRVFYEDLPMIKTGQINWAEAARSDILGLSPWYHVRFWGVWRQP
jgi:peptide/nickel transport system substrate-binding protein